MASLATVVTILCAVLTVKLVQCDVEAQPASATETSGEDIGTERTGRVMKILNNHKMAPHGKRARVNVPKIHSRADRYVGPPQRLPPVFHRMPANVGLQGRPPQILRRVQSNIPTAPQQRPPNPQRFNYEPLVKSSRYSPAKGNLQYSNGKSSNYRPQQQQLSQIPQQQQQHPNALGNQGPSQQYIQNFKASPHFNGKAIIRPLAEEQDPYNAFEQQYKLQQYPIPGNQAQQQYSSYQAQAARPQYQPQLKSYQESRPNSVKSEQPEKSAPASAQTYSVYEEHPEAGIRTQVAQHSRESPVYSQNYLQTNTEVLSQEAQDYLKFMSTNEYFLPKRDPNYKKLDAELDRRQYEQQQQRQQHQQQQQQQQHQQQQQQQQLQQQQHDLQHQHDLQQQQQQPSQSSRPLSESEYTPSYNKPVHVSDLFYHQNPAPNAAIVRGSYQAGNNVFVVKSDGNKAVKHIVASPLPTEATTQAPSYTQVRFNSLKRRTPEPVRFEFTERDAVPSTYTNSPLGQLRYKSVGDTSTPSSASDISKPAADSSPLESNISIIKPISEVDDDPEDGEDMQEAGSDVYGRVPVVRPGAPSTATSSEPPSEQKDTEEYCERICANVQDEDEEIVCGSDGYMYTSEAQMECYASCLHIDVTIQSKGSCSAS